MMALLRELLIPLTVLKRQKNLLILSRIVVFTGYTEQIFKYEERSGEVHRYVKKIWLKRNEEWISTRKCGKIIARIDV